MEPLIIIAVAVAAFIVYQVWKDGKRRKEQERRRREADEYEAMKLAQAAQSELRKVKEAKTAATKEKALHRALGHLKELRSYEAGPRIVVDLEGEIKRIEAAGKVVAIVEKVEAADKHRFKGGTKSEINALTDALYEIEKRELDTDTFLQAGVAVTATGEVPTVEGIEQRLHELGWERPK